MQCACAILSSVACPALQNGSTLFHEGHDFRRKKMLLNIKCVFFLVFLQLLSEIFFILRRNERDMIKRVYWSSCELPFILMRFLLKLAIP